MEHLYLFPDLGISKKFFQRLGTRVNESHLTVVKFSCCCWFWNELLTQSYQPKTRSYMRNQRSISNECKNISQRALSETNQETKEFFLNPPSMLADASRDRLRFYGIWVDESKVMFFCKNWNFQILVFFITMCFKQTVNLSKWAKKLN